MQIPNFTRCPICDCRLKGFEDFKYCPPCARPGHAHKFEFSVNSHIIIDIAYYYLDLSLVICKDDSWKLTKYFCYNSYDNSIAKGANASELFDFLNAHKIKETMQTLEFYS